MHVGPGRGGAVVHKVLQDGGVPGEAQQHLGTDGPGSRRARSITEKPISARIPFVLEPVAPLDLESIRRRNFPDGGHLRSVIKWLLVSNYPLKWVYFYISVRTAFVSKWPLEANDRGGGLI